jgi:hypothetical protein
MRTGHIPLNVFLEKIGKVNSARCPACRHTKEDMRHFLMDCPSYAHKRWPLYRHCKKNNPSLKDLLNVKKMMVPIANYVQATSQFEQGGAKQRQEEQGQRRREESMLEDK